MKKIAASIVLALFAVLACLYMTSCVTLAATYRGVTGSYDGKRVAVTVDGDRLVDSLRGFKK